MAASLIQIGKHVSLPCLLQIFSFAMIGCRRLHLLCLLPTLTVFWKTLSLEPEVSGQACFLGRLHSSSSSPVAPSCRLYPSFCSSHSPSAALSSISTMRSMVGESSNSSASNFAMASADCEASTTRTHQLGQHQGWTDEAADAGVAAATHEKNKTRLYAGAPFLRCTRRPG